MTKNAKTTEPETDEAELEDESETETESEDDDETEAPDRLSDNNAVALCISAYNITLDKERAKLDEDDHDFDAKEVANKAFLAALPPLSGYQNICDFIACVNQAYLWEIIGEHRAARLFAAAKLALGAFRSEPKRARSTKKRAGRPKGKKAKKKMK